MHQKIINVQRLCTRVFQLHGAASVLLCLLFLSTYIGECLLYEMVTGGIDDPATAGVSTVGASPVHLALQLHGLLYISIDSMKSFASCRMKALKT